MFKNQASYSKIPTKGTKRWPYAQYYLGEKDSHHRRNGHGQNCWSGPESLEWFTGKFLHDTMHGEGEYRWRFQGPDNASVTYEGQFYGNSMHGYGVMSYPDGRVFNGLFYKNMRWGPGIESHACLQEDVGLWQGTKLIRLAWRPQTPSITLDLVMGPNGKAYMEAHRKLLTSRTKIIGEVNSALELLKQSGAEPLVASEKWNKLYSKYCTDFNSQACHVDVFDYEYNKNDVQILEELDNIPQKMDSSHNTEESPAKTYYAWNNSEMMINMMKSCYKQEHQRKSSRLHLSTILSGPRSQYKRPGNLELNCRSLLMASYLGDVTTVTRLINESKVHPDVADVFGNTALVYAVCGDQTEIMHFLVEAGVNANSYNDSCCTPLGIALMRFACARKGIAVNGMVQALLPPLVVPPAPIAPLEERPLEWQIVRDQAIGGTLNRSASKTANKTIGPKKTKTSLLQVVPLKSAEQINDEIDPIVTQEKQLFNIVNAEFSIRMAQLFIIPSEINPIPYLFEANDMVKEIEAGEEEQKKTPDKNAKKAVSKIIKDTIKPSKEILWQKSDKDISSITSADRARIESLNRNMSTILQLLSDGADPRLVRCPQPAILLATVAGSLDLVRDLVNYGVDRVDVNEVFPQIHHYTALDWTVSQPLSFENLYLARTLLECGAKTNHRLKCEAPQNSDSGIPGIEGPTLLHAVLVKKTVNEQEEEIRRQLLELLLEYRCCPLSQFRGRSALDIAMKNMDTFDIFIKSPNTDLNAPINDSNQNVLVKMFSNPFCKSIPITERLQTITNLLLFGADPFLPCQDGEEKFVNFFVFAKKSFSELDTVSKPSNPVGKQDPKLKKPEKPKKDERLSMKSAGKLGADDIGDYKQALDLVAECARILHVRWLQAKLLKELIKVVERYEHRPWNMIIPEPKNKKACALWLTCHRSLEIWSILKTRRKKTFKDRRILKHVLCIVQFYCRRNGIFFKQRMTAEEKDAIEADVNYILREHKQATDMETEHVALSRPYVMPELALDADGKFEVCFECALPLNDEKILCSSCKLVSFCSLDCMQVNIHRIGCHPCSDYLKMKYCTSPEQSESLETNI